MTSTTADENVRREVVHFDHAGLARLESLSVAEAADLLHVSERTIYREIDRGRIRAVRVGRAVRIPVCIIENYLVGEAV